MRISDWSSDVCSSDLETSIEVDPALADVAITLPPATANADWAQPGGNAAKSMGHVALGGSPARTWSVSIGQGSSKTARLAAAPVVANGKVFTIDSQATVRASSADNGGTLWQTQIGRASCRERVCPIM